MFCFVLFGLGGLFLFLHDTQCAFPITFSFDVEKALNPREDFFIILCKNQIISKHNKFGRLNDHWCIHDW